MEFRENFIEELSKINESNFNKKALVLFNYQYTHNEVYRKYTNALKKNPENVKSITEIPFLPVSFFQSEKIITGTKIPERCFYSSGTTDKSQRSKHYIVDILLYEKVFTEIFTKQYGPVSDYIVLALLPSYMENQDSSLLYMVNNLIYKSKNKLSGFISTDFDSFLSNLSAYRRSGKRILLFGVSYSLLDLAEMHRPDLSDFIIVETGGMKGRRKEMIKEEMHQFLKTNFNNANIHSEYGMTELLSQVYSTNNGLFECCPWMKVLIRKVNDPFDVQPSGRGAINIIDLANIDSCAFIEIQDMANIHPDGKFELLGRMDNSEQRGCNLLYV